MALVEALKHLRAKHLLLNLPLKDFVAAASVGMVKGQPVLDLNYAEDSSADVDMNIVMTGQGQFIELQGTAERQPFVTQDLTRMLKLAEEGIQRLIGLQHRTLGASSLRTL